MTNEKDIIEAIENVNCDWEYDLSSLFLSEVAKAIIDKIREEEKNKAWDINLPKVKSASEILEKNRCIECGYETYDYICPKCNGMVKSIYIKE